MTRTYGMMSEMKNYNSRSLVMLNGEFKTHSNLRKRSEVSQREQECKMLHYHSLNTNFSDGNRSA